MSTPVLRLSALAALALPLTLPAQTAAGTPPGNGSSLASAYSLTKTGWGSANRITNPGAIYTIRIDGLLARAIADHITPTNTIVDGKLLPAAKGFRGAFGASGDSEQVERGQRFYLHDVETANDGVVFTLLSLDSVNVVNQGASTHSRVRLYLKFALPKDQLAQLTPEALHRLTDPVFAPENSAPTVQLGQSMAEVRQVLGEPDKEIDLGPKKVLVYKSLKVTFTDDKVTDAE
jgi:hypothetical protein